MTDRFRITLAQLNATVGDIAGNAALARSAWEEGRAAGAQLVALPEMFITGYNTQDLVVKPAFHTAAIRAIEALAKDCADGPALAIGGPAVVDSALHNGYYILKKGQIQTCVLKHELPNETVFDEVRVYAAGPLGGVFAGAQWSAILPKQVGGAPEPDGRPRGRNRSAAHLPQPGGRPG